VHARARWYGGHVLYRKLRAAGDVLARASASERGAPGTLRALGAVARRHESFHKSAARAESGIPGFNKECQRFDALCATCMYDPPSSRDS
jgi:hypothetical protein